MKGKRSTIWIHIAFAPGDFFFAGNVSASPPDDRAVLCEDSGKVALGINDAYFLVWSDGKNVWYFYGQHQQLDQILSEANNTRKSIEVRHLHLVSSN